MIQLIVNRLGIDKITHNPQLKKHKTMKISVITDTFNVMGNVQLCCTYPIKVWTFLSYKDKSDNTIPISVDIFKSSIYDSKIIENHLDTLYKDSPLLFDNNNILIGDAAYDSNNLLTKIKCLKLGKLLAVKNIRNTKDINKINAIKYNLVDNMILKSRICVEHILNHFKQYKRLAVRYDKYSNNYKTFLYFAALFILVKKTNI